MNNMIHFHKPRTYKSSEGCCVCRSKTSSSRFIDSHKFEHDIRQCFDLKQPIKGEICNACVLLTKRFKRFPVGRKKPWGHIVENRVGNTNDNKLNGKYRSGCNSCTTNNHDNQDHSNRKQKYRKGNLSRSTSRPNDGSNIDHHEANIKSESPTTTKKPKVTTISACYPGLFVSKRRNNRSQSNYNRSQILSRSTDLTKPNPDVMDQNYKNKRLQKAAGNTVVQFQIQTRASTHHQSIRTQPAIDARKGGGIVSKIRGSKRRKSLPPRKFRKTSAFDEFVQFFDETEWQKKKTCCGTIYECTNLMGFLFDTAQYKLCEKHKNMSVTKAICDVTAERISDSSKIDKSAYINPLEKQKGIANNSVNNQKLTSTPALKKHYLFNKRQTESFIQAALPATSAINANFSTVTKTVNNNDGFKNTSVIMANSAHPCNSDLKDKYQKSTLNASCAALNTTGNNLEEIINRNETHIPNMSSKTSQLTIVPPLSSIYMPSSISIVPSSSQLSLTKTTLSVVSPASSTKFSDNSSDSGFDEALLERKSVSPLQDDTEKKIQSNDLIGSSGAAQSQVIKNTPSACEIRIKSQIHKCEQREKQFNYLSSFPGTANTSSITSSIKLSTQIKTPSERLAQITISPITTTGYNINSTQSKIYDVYNKSKNTIQHENGVTMILPASSLAASNQVAAMKYMQPSKVTITPALPSGMQHATNINMNRKLSLGRDVKYASARYNQLSHQQRTT